MKNKKITLLLLFSILTSFLFSNFKNQLKDDYDFMNKINLKSKKYRGLSERTVYNIWKSAPYQSKSQAFDHLTTLSAIKYDQINFNCSECKKNKMVLINGDKYYYSNLIYTDSKSINQNELIDIYILFDLICAVKKRNEISISSSSLKSEHTASTESIVVDSNLLPKGWNIPILSNSPVFKLQDLSGLELINKTINKVSLNQLIPTEYKWAKPIPSLSFLGGSLYFLSRVNGWANYSTTLEGSGEKDIFGDQQMAQENYDKNLQLGLVLGAISVYHLYDWIVNY